MGFFAFQQGLGLGQGPARGFSLGQGALHSGNHFTDYFDPLQLRSRERFIAQGTAQVEQGPADPQGLVRLLILDPHQQIIFQQK